MAKAFSELWNQEKSVGLATSAWTMTWTRSPPTQAPEPRTADPEAIRAFMRAVTTDSDDERLRPFRTKVSDATMREPLG